MISAILEFLAIPQNIAIFQNLDFFRLSYYSLKITQPIAHTEWSLIMPYDHLDLTLLIYKCLVHTGKIIIAEKDHMNSQGQFSHISVLLLQIDNIY